MNLKLKILSILYFIVSLQHYAKAATLKIKELKYFYEKFFFQNNYQYVKKQSSNKVPFEEKLIKI